MIQKLTIERETGNGKYADVLDVVEFLALDPYGTAPNAACQLIRRSPEFAAALEKLRNGAADGPESSGNNRPCTQDTSNE